MLNWNPVVDYEIREIERETRLQQLRRESEQMRNETDQLKRENAQYAVLNARIAALWPNSNSSSTQVQPPKSDSPI